MRTECGRGGGAFAPGAMAGSKGVQKRPPLQTRVRTKGLARSSEGYRKGSRTVRCAGLQRVAGVAGAVTGRVAGKLGGVEKPRERSRPSAARAARGADASETGMGFPIAPPAACSNMGFPHVFLGDAGFPASVALPAFR